MPPGEVGEAATTLDSCDHESSIAPGVSPAGGGDPGWRFAQVDVDDHRGTTVTCAANRRALAGGLFWKNSLGSTVVDHEVGISRVTSNGRGWRVAGWNVGGGSPTLVATVLCSPRMTCAA
jgi:hypothetical protein